MWKPYKIVIQLQVELEITLFLELSILSVLL